MGLNHLGELSKQFLLLLQLLRRYALKICCASFLPVKINVYEREKERKNECWEYPVKRKVFVFLSLFTQRFAVSAGIGELMIYK